MSGKINVYDPTLGVMRTRSVFQVKDGEVLVAQNAVPGTYQSQRALRKRDGMRRINALAMDTPILHVENMPFGEPANGRGDGEAIIGLYVRLNSSNDWARTTDGLTWETSGFTMPPDGLDFSGIGSSHEASWILGDGRVLFPAVVANGFEFYTFDAEQAELVFTQTTTLTAFSSLWRLENGVVYWCAITPALTAGQHGVFVYNGASVAQLGAYPVDFPIEIVWFDGTLYCGAARFTGGAGPNRIYAWTGAAWTLAKEYTPTASAGIDFLSCATFKNGAYFGAGSDKVASPEELTTKLVRFRSQAWSNNLAPFTAGRVAALYAYEGALFLTRATDRIGSMNFVGGQIYRSTDAVTWTLDKDFGADVDIFVCMRVFAGYLWVLVRFRTGVFELWKRGTSGVWAQDTGPGTIETETMFAV